MDLVTLATACALQGATLAAPPDPQCEVPHANAAMEHARALSDASERLQPWEAFINEAAQRFDVPPTWIRRIIKVESGGNTMLHGRPITSAAGAMGLMQLMPGTYADMRQAYHLGGDPFDPHDNILAGTAYLRAMFDRFGRGVFAAYNAGPQHYQDYLDGRRSLPAETVSYIAKLDGPSVLPGANITTGQFNSSANDLFFALSSHRVSASQEKLSDGVGPRQPRGSPRGPKNNLFFPLSTAKR